jgi:hypothetical protein
MLLGSILSSGKKSASEVFVAAENEQAYLSGGSLHVTISGAAVLLLNESVDI